MSTPKSNNDALIISTSSTSQVLTLNDFGQYDSDTTAIQITKLPTSGTLQYKNASGTWTSVSANQTINVADISGEKLQFVPSTVSTDPSLLISNSSLSFSVSNGSSYSTPYTLTVYKADIDDDVRNFLNELQTGFTVASTDETPSSVKITVAPSANVSSLLDSSLFSILASKGLEKFNSNNYLILNSVDDSISGFYIEYGLGNINPFTSLASKLDTSSAEAKLQKFADVSAMPSFGKNLIGVLQDLVAGVGELVDTVGSYDLNLNVKISDDGNTLQIPLAGSHNTDDNVSLSEVGVELSTSINNYTQGLTNLVLGDTLGDSDYATILASDSVSLGNYAILKVKAYDPTQDDEPALYSSVALDMGLPWNPLKPNELSLALSLNGSVTTSGWNNPFGLSSDIAINSLGLALGFDVTVGVSTTTGLPKIDEIAFDVGFSGGATIRATDEINLALATGVELKMPDESTPPELNLGSVAFSIDTHDEPVGFGNILRLMENTAQIGSSNLEVLNKAFDKVTISSTNALPLFSVSTFSTDMSIGTKTIETGLFINGEMSISNAFSSSVSLNINPNPEFGVAPYLEAGFAVSIPVIGNLAVTLDVYDFDSVKLKTSFGSINVNVNDFNLENIPKIIENQVMGQLGQLASWIEGQLEDIGASTVNLANDAANVITGTYKEVSGEIQNIAGNVGSAISSGATSTFKSITKALGLSSKQDSPITWVGTDGDDKHDGHHERGDFLAGNGGNDYIWSDQGDDSIDGGTGNDTLIGYDGNDQMNGGDGNDYLNGEDGEDSSYGGAGDDYLNESSGGYSDFLDGGIGNDTLLGGDKYDTLYGGAGNDSLTGGNDDDTLRGGAGNDVINGGNGTDTVDFSDENNGVKIMMSGSTGTATTLTAGTIYIDTLSNLENIVGTVFSDSIAANSSSNAISADDGNNSVWGGSGNDTISAGSGNDSIDGESGNDIIKPGDGNDTISGGGDTDTVDYSVTSSAVTIALNNSSATVIAADGNDILSAIDNLIGTIYADKLSGDSGNNSLNGNNGNDTLSGGTGNDTLDGGSGSDTVDYSSTTGAGITVDLNGSTATFSASSVSNAGSDTLKNIENLIGTSYADKLVGDSNSNVFTGGGSNDSIYGDSGNDMLDGGTGNDSIEGNDGHDSLIGGDGNDTMQGGNNEDTLEGGTGNDYMDGNDGYDHLFGDDGNDTLLGGNHEDTLDGGVGDDSIIGGSGNNVLTGSYGNDTLIVNSSAGKDDGNNSMSGGDGNDFLRAGYKGNDMLDGGIGNDTVDGGSYGNDYLTGGSGNDSVTGWNDSQTLNGGDGSDTLRGGAGNDTFKFDLDSDTTKVSYDVITDFSYGSSNQDKIDLSSIDANLSVTGDQAFSIVTSSTFTATGQLRFDSATKMLYGNVDSDTDPEFSVLLTGVGSVNTAYFAL